MSPRGRIQLEIERSRFRKLCGRQTLPFHSFNGSSVSSNRFWSKHRNDVSYNQLQKAPVPLELLGKMKKMALSLYPQ
ncbi:UNVERIFIED_CONTAM: hypothetical protein Sindi_2395300, partial [Sesamum indicum]